MRVCLHVYLGLHSMTYMCKSEDSFRSQFSSPTIPVPGIKFRSRNLAARGCTYWVILPAPWLSFELPTWYRDWCNGPLLCSRKLWLGKSRGHAIGVRWNVTRSPLHTRRGDDSNLAVTMPDIPWPEVRHDIGSDHLSKRDGTTNGLSVKKKRRTTEPFTIP